MPYGSYSVSDIQEIIDCIIKKHETLATIPPMHVYTSKINDRLVLKDGYQLELQMPKTMKLFGSTKILTNKSKKKWRKRIKS